MGLRTSSSLRILVILLFSFGMIAPALTSSTQDGTSSETKLVSNDSHFDNSIASLLEENKEGERESKDHKSTITFICFDFSKTYAQFAFNGLRQISRVELNSMDSQPLLFTLFHTFLI